tara:strand:+ start:447 stop:650 length:204 start_codon:yes stop_codon:yes gene_type:complete
MLNKITKIQTDYTYDVEYDNTGYTVVCEENLIEAYLEWSVFDEDGELVAETAPKLNNEIIAFIIQNT